MKLLKEVENIFCFLHSGKSWQILSSGWKQHHKYFTLLAWHLVVSLRSLVTTQQTKIL